MIKSLSKSLYYCDKDDDHCCPKIFMSFSSNEVTMIDVGNIKEHYLECLDFINKKKAILKNIVITHFHPDHLENLAYVDSNINIYCSKNTARYVEVPVNIVNEDMNLSNLKLLLVPSLHSKGSLCILDNDFLLLGDSLYSREIDGKEYINKEIIFEMRKKFEAIPFKQGVFSHDAICSCLKRDILSFLQKVMENGSFII